MKGPHFFEKRKKEMAKAQKAKEKADRKALRKANGGKAEDEEFLDADGLPINAEGQATAGTADGDEAEPTADNDAGTTSEAQQSQPDRAPAVAGAFRGTPGA